MSKQIFRKIVPPIIMFKLLEFICLKMDKYYLIDVNAYKKMLYYDLHIKFSNDIIDYYHVSKRFYVDREMSYNSFTNIIRQICKTNDIMFTSKMKYSESKYSIDYLIYFPATHTHLPVEIHGEVVDDGVRVDAVGDGAEVADVDDDPDDTEICM